VRVVLDTNVLISAIAFGGIPRRILESVLSGTIELCTSEALVEELRGVLQRPKFGLSPQLVQTIISELTAVASWVVPEKRHSLIDVDPADNEVLDCAVAAEADYIVSGDAHLLRLEKCETVQITTVERFATILAKQ
jgi:putative PIN family toxin of toxin-antitoxin system